MSSGACQEDGGRRRRRRKQQQQTEIKGTYFSGRLRENTDTGDLFLSLRILRSLSPPLSN